MAENEEGKDVQSYRKLCQFWGVLQLIENDDVYNRFLDQVKVNKELEIIIKKEGDINYQFSSNDSITLCNPELAGCAALHLAVGRKNEIVKVLLSRQGIDITLKNHNGSTALHEDTKNYYYYYKGRWQMHGSLENNNRDMILSAHVELNVSDNPCNKNGISHFHIACMANNVKVVAFFISRGASVNQVVVGDFSPFLGYTPLHFAVVWRALETVEILLRCGADINKKDSRGLTPVHLLLEQNMTIDSNKIMRMLLRYIINFKDRLKFDGKDWSLFHMACTLQNTTILEQLLTEVEDIDPSVDLDSTFTAHFDMKILKFLLQREANNKIKNANGLTPFDICLERYELQDLYAILSSDSLRRDILLLDNKTRLLDVICAMKDSKTLDDFLKDVESCQLLRLPNDSALWPGCTLLHLAVNFSNNEGKSECTKGDVEEFEREYIARIGVCLNRGIDVTAQDARGWTALHLAYRLQKANAVKLLLQEQTQIVNPIDEDNLSHLYVACAFNCPRLVEKLLSNDKVDVNVRIKSSLEGRRCKEAGFFATAGSTPLHAAVTSGSPELVRTLLEHGANANAKDSNGVTPLHRTLACNNAGDIGRMLLSLRSAEEYTFRGLNYLHLAAEFGSDENVIDRFIRLGADVNSAIDFRTEAQAEDNLLCVSVDGGRHQLAEPFAFMSNFNKYRPVDIAILRSRREVVEILLKRGVDIFATSADGWTLVHRALRGCFCDDLILSVIKGDVTLQQRMQAESGITMLHLACKDCNIDDVKHCLRNGSNVNAQVKLDSPVWPRYTAMRVLALQAFRRGRQETILHSIMELLLANGADLELMNSEKNTPIHDIDPWSPLTESLLKNMTNFNVYPTDAWGISHFHVACLRNNLAVMEQLLKCNVNQPVALHSSKFPGCTPLHLVLQPESGLNNDVRVEAIDLLFRHGANVHATDLYDNTLFHAVTKCAPPRNQLFEKLWSIGASINAKNLFGEEPLGMLLSSRKFEYAEVKFFLKHNCHANLYDPIREEGYLKFLFGNNHPIRKIVKHPSISKVDDFGRNAIHNIVSWEYSFTKSYYQIIPTLMERGCSIDCQDQLGRTPLHLAVKFRNCKAVTDLLGAGADINVTDATGDSPFSCYIFSLSKDSGWHQFQYGHSQIVMPMAMHIYKLQITGLYVSDLNAHILEELLKKCSLDEAKVKRAHDELTKMKNLKIDSTILCPYDFFSETRAIAAFPHMTLSEQQAINTFFTSIKKRDFAELGYLLKIRHRKALRRLSLLIPAKVGLDVLSKCALPDKCSQHILRFLSNAEIENVIASVNLIF